MSVRVDIGRLLVGSRRDLFGFVGFLFRYLVSLIVVIMNLFAHCVRTAFRYFVTFRVVILRYYREHRIGPLRHAQADEAHLRLRLNDEHLFEVYPRMLFKFYIFVGIGIARVEL